MTQNELREQTRIAKAVSDFEYKEMAEILDMHPNSFYNWLSGAQPLSRKKQAELLSLLDDICS